MRRSRRRTAQAEEKSQKSSSDDSDHQSTMDIIDKMSKKFFGSAKRTSRTSSRLDVAYEGDVSSSVGTTSSSSDKSTDLYDFDEANEEDLCLVLFPESSKSKSGSKTKSTKKKTSQKPAGRLTSSTKKQEPIQRSSSRCSDRKCSLRETVKSPTSATTKKQDSTKKVPGLKQADPNIKQAKPTVEGKNENSRPVRSSAKKRKPDSPTQTPELRKKSHRENTNPVEVSMFDSGVFVSPIEKVTNSSLTTPDITPIPTPSLSISQVSLDRDLSPIQFDSLLEESLSLSPVKAQELLTSPAKRPRTEPMDVGSPQLRTSIVEKNYAHRGQFMSPSERKEKKKARSKPRVTTKRVDEWATKMNAEFNEIEMYDLSIEDP